jgi:MFS family permease
MSATAAAQEPIRSTIPARLDRLGWSPFHTRMVCGLGAAWILDGLHITIASSVTGVLSSPGTLNMTSTEIGLIASVYLVGQIIGALVFGRMSDQLGRRRLLVTSLLLYLLGTGAAAFTTGHHHGWLLYFYATRLVAGMGIGGQYAAINSAIDEMMPSKYRGRVDIWINGSYWAGAILGSFASLLFLNAFAVNLGWRLAFLMGPAFYGWLIGNGSSRTGLFIGYLVGAAIMILGGVVELLIGINAEGKSLEDVTKPLSAADQTSTIRPAPTTTPAEA